MVAGSIISVNTTLIERYRMNIAVYGGTFDPPTLAHEAIISSVLQQNGIDQVWVMPSALRADKPGMTSQSDRLALLTAMRQTTFAAAKKLVVSTFEIDLLPPSETYRTFSALTKTYPQHKFMYVFGADSYADMPNWRGGCELQKSMGVLLVERAGYTLPPEGKNSRNITVPAIADLALSSSGVRAASAQGDSIQDMVSPAVYDYITQHDLYKTCTIHT